VSKSGSRYLQKQKAQKKNRWKKNPLILFIRSLDFLGKLALGALLLGIAIFNIYHYAGFRPLLFITALSIVFFPFAKRGTDDVIQPRVSERVFEMIDDRGFRGLGPLYLFTVLALSIPLGLIYMAYHYWQYRKAGRE
jgi:hypothetical protein